MHCLARTRTGVGPIVGEICVARAGDNNALYSHMLLAAPSGGRVSRIVDLNNVPLTLPSGGRVPRITLSQHAPLILGHEYKGLELTNN